MTRTFLLLAGALLALGAVRAQTVQIGPNGVNVTNSANSVSVTAAGGGPVSAVTGSGKTLSYTCHNSRVSVSGSGNSVSVAAGTIWVAGSANAVTWHSVLNGRRPTVAIAGLGNTVQRR